MDARIADDESGRRHGTSWRNPGAVWDAAAGGVKGGDAPARWAARLAARRDAQHADHAVGLVAGQVADVLERVGRGERDRGLARRLRAGIEISVGRALWYGSVPVRWRSWRAASPTIHSWSIGSVFVITNVTGLPTGTVIARRVVVRAVDRDRDHDRVVRVGDGDRADAGRDAPARRRTPRPRIAAADAQAGSAAGEPLPAARRRLVTSRQDDAGAGRADQSDTDEPDADEGEGDQQPAHVDRRLDRRLRGIASPAATADGSAGAGRVDREVVVELARQCRRPRPSVSQPDAGTQSIPRSERRSSSRLSVAGVARGRARMPFAPVGDRQERRGAVGQEVDVGLDRLAAGLAEGEDPERDPRVGGRDRDVDRRAVADLLAAGLRRIGVEGGGEEDRAALRVEVEDLGRVGREPEAVGLGPLRRCRPRRP